MTGRRIHPLSKLFGWLVILFLAGPIVIVIGTSVSDTPYLAFPPQGFTLKWYANVFNHSGFLDTFIISMQVAVGGTLIALVTGLAAAYALTRYRMKIPGWYGSVFFLPFFIPEIVFGFSLLKTLIVQFQLPILPSLILGHAIHQDLNFGLPGRGEFHDGRGDQWSLRVPIESTRHEVSL